MGTQARTDANTWEIPPLRETGPRVWVLLPDQQEIRGMLVAQVQGSTGAWFCMVAVAGWEHVQVEGQDRAQATSVVLPVPATHVERIEGERYEGIPTHRHPAPQPVGPDGEWWYVQQMCGTGELRYLHHARCWCPGPRDERLDAERARQELLVPGTVPCSACDPKKEL